MEKRKRHRLPGLFLAIMLLASLLAGCQQGAGKDGQGEAEGKESQGDTGENQEEEGDQMETQVFKLEDFGGAGDGTTDNGEAISMALSAAKRAEGPSVIEFEKDATYYFEKVPGEKSIFAMEGMKDVTLKGDNTTISMNMGRLDGYANFERCENIRVEGFNFKTSESVYAIGTVLDASVEQLYIDVQSDRDLGITETYTMENADVFGRPLTDYNRAHMYMDRIEVLDAAAFQYRICLKDMDNVQHKMQSMMRDNLQFLFPRPGWGQTAAGGGAFIVTSTTNLELENLNLWSASGFCFHMRYNDGTILIRNVNITPEPGTDMAMSGWRDGFHLKNNPGQFTFEDCTIEKNLDDAFNTGVTSLRITQVFSETEFEMSCGEFGGIYYGRMDAGDTLMIYDENNGGYVTTATIQERVENPGSELPRVIISEPNPDLMAGLSASPLDVGQPGMVIRNCYINGTYRFRTPLTCENTEFATMFAWFDNIPDLEGPTAAHQHFTNCKFYRVAAPDPADSFGNPDYMMEVGTVIRNPESNRNVFRVEDLVFENCEIDPDLIYWKNGYEVTINGEVFSSGQ